MTTLHRRRFLKTALPAGMVLGPLLSCGKSQIEEPTTQADVLVYGGTPAGIAAALGAARSGCQVLLVEPTAKIGGMLTSGLSHTDFRTFEAITGTFLRFTQRVQAHYEASFGKDSEQARMCFRGTNAEPKVNLQVLEQMLAEEGNVRVLRNSPLLEATTSGTDERNWISGIRVKNKDGASRRLQARVFVDASYEGDLMAASGVAFRVGREGRDSFGESLAPETADSQLQGYNFRLIATRDPALRVQPARPDGYQREDYAAVVPLLGSGRLKGVFGYPSDVIYKAQIPPLPNGKYDINDVSNGIVRLSLPGENLGWPEGDGTTRARIYAEHLRWNTGLLWFLQNDEAVPEPFRKEAREWGWCRDEFEDSAHLPPQLYVREARRMQGQRTFTQADSAHAPGDARAILHRDSIATGDYGNNCHGTAHEGDRIGGRHTGEFYQPVAPYQIPYATLLPREVSNLLVPVAAGSSHVGFCALRLEPIWTSLGDAAGIAAALAVEAGIAALRLGSQPSYAGGAELAHLPVQTVSTKAVQRKLWAMGAATIYFSDVLPGDANFAANQWWGTMGGFHGLFSTPDRKQLRGKQIIGQYFEAFPYHAAEPGKPVDEATAARWLALANELAIGTSGLAPGLTRSEWIRILSGGAEASLPG